jgi:hypothetical protein
MVHFAPVPVPEAVEGTRAGRIVIVVDWAASVVRRAE